jgi:uncharacterized membrane protein (UPF0136 family)
MINIFVQWSVFCYALLNIILGTYGYYVVGSLPSLVAGVGSGIFLLICSILIFRGKRGGVYGALLLTVLLTGIFSYRYTITEALFPASMAVLSGAMLIFLLVQVAHWKR